MEKTAKHSGSRLKRVLIILGIIVVALGIVFAVYVGNYSHADAEALAALNGCDGITVTEDSDGMYIFAPSGADVPNLHTGLIFYPGGKVEYTAYAPLMVKLAQRGITCFLVKVPCNLAFLKVNAAEGIAENYNEGMLAAQSTLTQAAALNGDSNGSITQALEDYQPIEHWYIGGHSLGGVAAAMYVANGHADEFDGLIFFGSYTGTNLSGLNLRVLTIVGENDGLVTDEKYEASVTKLPAGAVRYIIPGGCHAYFGSYGEQKGDGTATITPAQQREATADIVEKWIQQ